MVEKIKELIGLSSHKYRPVKFNKWLQTENLVSKKKKQAVYTYAVVTPLPKISWTHPLYVAVLSNRHDRPKWLWSHHCRKTIETHIIIYHYHNVHGVNSLMCSLGLNTYRSQLMACCRIMAKRGYLPEWKQYHKTTATQWLLWHRIIIKRDYSVTRPTLAALTTATQRLL